MKKLIISTILCIGLIASGTVLAQDSTPKKATTKVKTECKKDDKKSCCTKDKKECTKKEGEKKSCCADTKKTQTTDKKKK